MIDEIKRLVEKINECESEISNNESKLLETDINRLNKIVQVVINGLEFENIYRKQITYSNWRQDEEHYDKDENGKFLKGIKVDYIEVSYYKGLNGDYEVQKQLYLMDDGSFRVFNFTGRCSNNGRCVYEGTLSENQDIAQFDFDSIVKNILNNLHERFEKMQERRNIQLEKLAKVNRLEIG
jgi:hypothetical protein